MKIAVICGGISNERNVSLSSGSAIIKALKNLGHEVFPVDLGKEFDSTFAEITSIPELPPSPEELKQLPAFKKPKIIFETIFKIKELQPEIVVNGLHGGMGENGQIQAALDIAGLNYTGSKVLASSMAMNKTLTKERAAQFGVPTPRFLFAKKEETFSDVLSRLNLKYPLVVKPNDDGSSVGLSIVKDTAQFPEAWEKASALGDVLIEEFIEGRELTVAILGNRALPVVEIRPDGGVYDYEHKYQKGKTQYFCPAELDSSAVEKVQKFALLTYQSVLCSNYARVDFRLDHSGNLFMLEVNTLPGMTATSLVPKAAKAAGIEFEELINRIVNLALQEK